ncbi:MAG: DUF547 domain-containing protein [Bacteroidota bacterium]
MRRLISLVSTFILSISLHAATDLSSFFEQANTFFQQYVADGAIDYNLIKQEGTLEPLLQTIQTTAIDELDTNTKKAFLINAYNLLVIKGVIDHYPTPSVLDIPGFFDRIKHDIGGTRATLNTIEKKWLLKPYGDARLHFVLVCGAVGCPPIISEAYLPNTLETQLEQQTTLALNDPNFIQVDQANNTIRLSQIFKWYRSDFGGSQNTSIAYINRYREAALPADYTITFYDYNWQLNEQTATSTGALENAVSNSENRYVVSATIPKGTFEVKIFNNLYTQQTTANGELTDRATFFTALTSVLYGWNDRFNIGFDVRYRQVQYNSANDSPLSVFNLESTPSSRQGFTGIGPKFRYAPFEQLPNFSIQSAFWFATGDDLAGNGADLPYIDFNGHTSFTQIFNDFTINDHFSIFTELDIVVEDIGPSSEGHINRFSTPGIVILSYFPNPKTTLYGIGSYSPYWQREFDYFAQAGAGAKYQVTPKLEFELLYTWFTNDDLQSTGGRAATYNAGIRFNL